MKKINILFLLLLSCIFAQAQITFLSTDMPTLPWTNAQQEDTSTGFAVNFGNAGANQVYDFSSFHNQKLDSTYYLVPTSAQLSAVPNANLAVTNDHVTYLLGNKSASNFLFDGLQTTAFGTSILTGYTQLDTDYIFTTDYGQNFAGTYGGTSTIYAGVISSALTGFPLYWDSVRIVNSTTYTDTIDGWGTVKTPVGTYNCLRQHRVEHSTTTIYYNTTSNSSYTQMPTSILGTQVLASNPIKDTTNTYYYLSKETHGTVITFTYDSIHQPLTASWSTTPPYPVAKFGVTYGSNGLVTFSDSSTGLPLTYSWSYGDGTANGTSANPNHRYTHDSTYVVCLTVTNVSGNSTWCDTVTITNVVVPRAPEAIEDTASVVQSGTITLNVIANDSNFNAPDSICIKSVYGGQSGWANISGCTDIIFHPLVPGFTGLDSFYYVSCDLVLTTLCDTGLVVVDVLPLPAPVASFTVTPNGCVGATFVSHSQNADTLIWAFNQVSGAFDTTIYSQTIVAVPDAATSFSYNTFTVCLTALNSAAASSQMCDTFFFGCAGINSIPSSQLRIYPNPASDLLQIDLSATGSSGISAIAIYNMLGEAVRMVSVSQSIVSIPLADLSNGTYMIGIIDREQNKKIAGKFEVLR